MADILAELIAAVSEGISGPPQPGEPHLIIGPDAAADEPHGEWVAEAG